MPRALLARPFASATTLLSEAFSGTATTANAWAYGADACITAGAAGVTPATSLPACGANAPQDVAGSGTLQLTPPVNGATGWAFNKNAVPTAGGLSITFNYFSFGSSGIAGDGFALALTDASKALPTTVGGCCGSLGYATYEGWQPALANAYVGVGLDESGYFSAAVESKTGGLSSLLPNTITVRGAAATKDAYLFSYQNTSGQASTLPFSLYNSATSRPAGYTVNVTLTAAGSLSVAVDKHDGNGLVTYIAPTQIVGLNGQPAVPANVYLGIIASGGGANTRHQISNLTVTTIGTTATPTPAPTPTPTPAPTATPTATPTPTPTPAAGYISEAFTGTATTANAWSFGDDACITAGTTTTPTTSLPACGTNAPQDAPGSGALQLTPPTNGATGYVFNQTAIPTGGGIVATFNYFSFGSTGTPGDGLALVLTDASKALPATIGGCCGSLGYATYEGWQPPLTNAYLGIGFDESGYFSAANENKTGGLAAVLPNTISVRGAAATNEQYLLSAENTSGQAAALPFTLYSTATTRPAGLAVTVALSAAGLLSVAIDRHDGNGSITYIPPTQIVGVNGQPALPANVYLGFVGAGGGANTRHQISNVVVTAQSATAPTPTPTPAPVKASVVTYHNDSNRTGWNPNETILNTTNVNSTTFGLLTTVPLDGRVDAQPLVVPGETITGQGVHDVVYVATENDTIYAIDAESGAILTSRNLGTSVSYLAKDGCDNIFPVQGITGTPVIDIANNAIYLVTDTSQGTSAPDLYQIHKLALNNLSDLVAPVSVVPATTLSNGAAQAFPAPHERQHPGLLEANGNIYVAFGSTADAAPTFSRGVIAGFNAITLTPLTSNLYTNRLYEVSNPYYMSSIWQSGYGIAADSSGNIYFSTANSNPYTSSYTPAYNYPDSVLKLAGNLGSILDSFTQYTYFNNDGIDADFGAGGTMLVPDQAGGIYPHLLVAGGKDGIQYILNRDNLGGYTPNGPNKDLAELSNGPCWCGPAYFVGADGTPRIVTGGGNGITTWKLLDGTTLSITQEGRVSAANTNGLPDDGGAIPAISSNGTVAGTAILWFVQGWNNQNTFVINLQAYDASNLGHQLYQANAGSWTNFNSNAYLVPTVANGYVYVGSNKQLAIFGLLNTGATAKHAAHR